jgi:hypothetical protein
MPSAVDPPILSATRQGGQMAMSAEATEQQATRWLVAGAGGVLAIVQAVAALVYPPSEKFAATGADYLGDGLFVVALALTLAGLWGLRDMTTGRVPHTAAGAALVGQSVIAVLVIATLFAGRDVLEALFIVGFGIEVIGLLVMAIASRRVLVGLLVPALVVTLAFFSSGGAAAFGLVWLAIAFRRGY